MCLDMKYKYSWMPYTERSFYPDAFVGRVIHVLYYNILKLKMKELLSFYKRLAGCDRIALTPINEGRFYCRFYSKGLYLDRMFVKNINLQKDLISLSEEEEVIGGAGVLRLKEKYAYIANAKDEEGAMNSIGGE